MRACVFRELFHVNYLSNERGNVICKGGNDIREGIVIMYVYNPTQIDIIYYIFVIMNYL